LAANVPSESQIDFLTYANMDDNSRPIVAPSGIVWDTNRPLPILLIAGPTNTTLLTLATQIRTSMVLTGTFVFGAELFKVVQPLTNYPRARLSITNLPSGLPQLQLAGDTGRRYAIERRDLRQTNWLALTNLYLAGTSLKWTNTTASRQTNYFYRSREVP
jgi:hypothetical protein